MRHASRQDARVADARHLRLLRARRERPRGRASAARSMHGSLLLHSRPPSAPAIRQGVACIIPTVGRSIPSQSFSFSRETWSLTVSAFKIGEISGSF